MTQSRRAGAIGFRVAVKSAEVRASVTFTDGVAGRLSAEFLRVVSPSAEVQGHSPSERKLVLANGNVTIRAIEPVGNYAVRLVFSDGHNTGLYSWHYLMNSPAGRTISGTDISKSWPLRAPAGIADYGIAASEGGVEKMSQACCILLIVRRRIRLNRSLGPISYEHARQLR